jgi:hypothetical protein
MLHAHDGCQQNFRSGMKAGKEFHNNNKCMHVNGREAGAEDTHAILLLTRAPPLLSPPPRRMLPMGWKSVAAASEHITSLTSDTEAIRDTPNPLSARFGAMAMSHTNCGSNLMQILPFIPSNSSCFSHHASLGGP